jgi:CheY-specific phosphatase CheX
MLPLCGAMEQILRTIRYATPNTYTVTATDPTNGCTASDAIVVTQNITPPTVNAGIDTVLNCVRTSLVLQATSTTTGATFAWSNGTNTANNTISTPNTYTVTATNPANGCTASDALAVTQDITPPAVSAGIDTVLNCVRTSLVLQATSNVTNATFAWSNGTNTANNTVSSPNTYTVTATNPYNGCTASDVVMVTQDITPPTVNAGIDTVLNCLRTSLILQATSNVTNATFAWSNGTNTANNTVSTPNTYTVTATNPYNGCTASDAVVLTQNITPPTVNAGVDTVLNCVRTSLVLQATSNVTNATFAWSNGTNTANNTVASPNTYTVTATDPTNGCTASDAIVVTQNITPPTVNAGIDTVLNCVRTSLVLQATSTTTGATFAWSNGTNTANNTISTPNTYTVTATNPANGCTASDEVVVTQDITPPSVNAGIDTVLNCVRTSLVLQATSSVLAMQPSHGVMEQILRTIMFLLPIHIR